MDKSYITVKNQKMVAKVMVDDILYVEKIGRRIFIETALEKYCFYGNMQYIAPILDERFYEVLQNYYMNFSRVVSMREGYIVFDCGKKRILARDPFRKAKTNFYTYLKEHENICREVSPVNDEYKTLMKTFNLKDDKR